MSEFLKVMGNFDLWQPENLFGVLFGLSLGGLSEDWIRYATNGNRLLCNQLLKRSLLWGTPVKVLASALLFYYWKTESFPLLVAGVALLFHLLLSAGLYKKNPWISLPRSGSLVPWAIFVDVLFGLDQSVMVVAGALMAEGSAEQVYVVSIITWVLTALLRLLTPSGVENKSADTVSRPRVWYLFLSLTALTAAFFVHGVPWLKWVLVVIVGTSALFTGSNGELFRKVLARLAFLRKIADTIGELVAWFEQVVTTLFLLRLTVLVVVAGAVYTGWQSAHWGDGPPKWLYVLVLVAGFFLSPAVKGVAVRMTLGDAVNFCIWGATAFCAVFLILDSHKLFGYEVQVTSLLTTCLSFLDINRVRLTSFQATVLLSAVGEVFVYLPLYQVTGGFRSFTRRTTSRVVEAGSSRVVTDT